MTPRDAKLSDCCDYPSPRISLISKDPTSVSHGRGHWFDPSTAHHKSNSYEVSNLLVRKNVEPSTLISSARQAAPGARHALQAHVRHAAARQAALRQHPSPPSTRQ